MPDREAMQTDGSTGKTLGGAAVGAALGSTVGPAGTVVGGFLGGLIAHEEASPDEYDHDDLVAETFETVADATSDHDKLFVAHVSADRADGHPKGVIDDLDYVPDVLVQGFAGRNTIIEAETPGSIADDPGHMLAQLDDFRLPSYTRVLVVPSEITAETREYVDDAVEGVVRVAAPDTVDEHV